MTVFFTASSTSSGMINTFVLHSAAVDELFKSMGGTLEAFYFAFGDKDVFIIGDLPDNAAATALVLRVNASGAALCRQRC